MDRSRLNGDLGLARLGAEADRTRFALRRELRSGDESERALATRLAALDGDIARAKRAIEAELRREHFGNGTDRLLAWRREAA